MQVFLTYWILLKVHKIRVILIKQATTTVSPSFIVIIRIYISVIFYLFQALDCGQTGSLPFTQQIVLVHFARLWPNSNLWSTSSCVRLRSMFFIVGEAKHYVPLFRWQWCYQPYRIPFTVYSAYVTWYAKKKKIARKQI